MNKFHKVDSASLPQYLIEAIKNKTLSNCLLEVQAWAAKGDTAACVALAHAYFYGGHGLKKNYVEAKHWLERINEAEDPNGLASYLLGIIHYKGLVGAPDHIKGFKCFRRAALLGNTRSRIAVAAMQRNGVGTIRKPRTSKINFYRCSRDRELSLPMRAYLSLESCGLRKWSSRTN